MKRSSEKYTRGRTCIYNINYHLIWCTKYRRPVLTEDVERCLKQVLYQVASDNDFQIKHMEVGHQDHIHLLISASPKWSVTDIVKVLKGTSGRRLLKEFPELEKVYWKKNDRSIWSSSYFCETIGSSNEAAVAKYIDDQKKESGRPGRPTKKQQEECPWQ